jgi:hypothetical protein
VPAGSAGVLAAKQLSNGKIVILDGVIKRPVPACFSNALLKRRHVSLKNVTL